jgi:hypothetical protein
MSKPASRDPQIDQAVAALWTTLLELKREFSDVTLADANLPAGELDECFRGKRELELFRTLQRYAKPPHVAQALQRLIPGNVEDCRLYVSDRLWEIYSTLLTLHGRTAMLITMSFKDKRLYDWRADGSLNGTLRRSLEAGPIEAAKRMRTGGIDALVAELERRFQREAATL